MSDDAENMASSMTPLKWEGKCFFLSYPIFLFTYEIR